tara:strand:- start:8248 stop:11121 length:2874 start_codon:yes stop_codon:yes gene_type:complete
MDGFGFRFDGQKIDACTGDSIAAALTASGIARFRRTISGEQRGLFCGMGVCNDCLVEVDGVRSRRACMTQVEQGMEVSSQDDTRLGTLREALPALPEQLETADVLIVGAGPAGLTAALECCRMGAIVIVVDERDAAGGQYFKPRSEGARHIDAQDVQHRAGNALRAAATAAGVRILQHHTVWYARHDKAAKDMGGFELRTTGTGGRCRLSGKTLIVATGAYELPAIVPGWTLPGVMTIGAGQTLVRRYGVAPGSRTLIAGNGPLGLQLAAELTTIGGKVVAVAERSQLQPGGAMLRAALAAPRLVATGVGYQLRLRRDGVPLLNGWEVTGIAASGDALDVDLSQIGAAGMRRVRADAVCMGDGFAPQAELLRLLGCSFEMRDGVPRPVRDTQCETDIPGLFVAGDAGGLGGAQLALQQGKTAAQAALTRLGQSVMIDPNMTARVARIGRFQSALWQLYKAPPADITSAPDDLLICRCESVSLGQVRHAIDAGARDAGAVKRATRLGMGRCQGRYCTRPLVALLQKAGPAVRADTLFAPQLPVRPLSICAVALEKPEWAGHRESSPVARPAPKDKTPLGRETADLVVIGAGVTGLAAALFGAQAGASVICLDQGRLSAEASGGNAGSLHLQLLSWDFGSKAFAGGSAALRTLPLQQESIALWSQLQDELGGDFEMAVTGGMMVAESPDQIAFLEAKVSAEASVDIHSEVIGPDRIRAIAPHLSDRIVAAAWCPGEGKINPLPASASLAAATRAAGALIEELASVTGIVQDGDGYVIETGRGQIRTRRLVIAAGGWSAQIGRHLGVALPIRGAPLQMLVTEPAPPLVPCLLAHADRHLTMKQSHSGTIIIGGAWPAETGPAGQARVLPDSIEGNLWVAQHTLPALSAFKLVRSWAAMNIDIDGAPLLSAIPGHPRVVVAATANGYTLGPLMGREAAALALGRDLPTRLRPFTLDRFETS